MPTARKALGVLCLLSALALLAAYYVSIPYADFPSVAWHVVNILVVAAMGLTVSVNVVDSLHVRRDPAAHLRQLPRDAVTVVAAFVLMLYLHNSLLYAVPHAEDSLTLWRYLDPAAVAVLAWEGIALLSSGSRLD